MGEKREIIIGRDGYNRLILVCFTERNQKIRLISARLATKKERLDYEEPKYRTKNISILKTQNVLSQDH